MRKIIQLPFTHERFGNQLFRYAYARKLAEIHGAELQCDKWNGWDAFEDIAFSGIDEPGELLPPEQPPPKHFECVQLQGRFMRQQHLIYTRTELKRWFRIREVYINKDLPAGYVAAHFRQGDCLKPGSPYIIVRESCYEAAMKRFGYFWESCWKIREENPNLSKLHPPHLSFLNDFQIMMRAEVLFRANSTFSWWAAVLGSAKVYSPNVFGLDPGWQDAEFCEGNDCDFYPKPAKLILREE